MAVRRFIVKRSLALQSSAWPINQLASRAPEWWPGWPDGKKFAFVLTHDVESTKGLDRCRQLAEMEMRLGFRSSFNFVPEGEYDTPRSLRDFLKENRFEVGVHDLRHDGKLYSSQQHFRRHAEKINQYLSQWGAVGFRSGFMLHNLDWLRDLNILYDASTFDSDPFEPQPDGVNTIFPFWVGRNDGSGYVELPYTLPQDSTLFLLLRESGISTWIQKLTWIAEHGGLALLNAHPDYMSFNGNKNSLEYRAQFYERFLEHVAQQYQKDAWFALPEEVAAYLHSVKSRLVEPDQKPIGTIAVNSVADRKDIQTPVEISSSNSPTLQDLSNSSGWRLHGKRAAMVMFSHYPSDPRPRRAAEALVSEGMRVELICLAADSRDPKRETVNGVEVRRVSITRVRGSIFTYIYQYTAFLLVSAAILSKRSLTHGYDLVYVHNMPDVLVLSALTPKLLGAKVILDLHDPMPELMMTIFGARPNGRIVRLLRRIEKWSMALADAVITVNRACAKLFTSRSCPSGKIGVVMNSPDEGIFGFRPRRTTPTPILRKPFVIMYHGSLVERNGLDLAVDALARVRESIPNVELRIYGSRTPFLDRVTESIRNKGLQESIKYLGPKTLEELVGAIEECDLGIIPNRRSIFTELNTPTRIFEYLAIGKPVIAPRAPGICDYFDDNSLLFFELGNAEDLAKKIEYVVSHPGEVNEIVRRGQEVHREHAWSKERIRLITVVNRLLSNEITQVDSTDRMGRSTQLPTSPTSQLDGPA